LGAAVRETKEKAEELMTGQQASTAVALEILAELRLLRKDGVKIQWTHGKPTLDHSPDKARPKTW
jgi:hypothetical protein